MIVAGVAVCDLGKKSQMPALSTETIARTVHSGYDLVSGVRASGFRRIHLAGPLDIATIIELTPAVRSAEMEVVSLDSRVCSGRIFGDPDIPLSLAATDDVARRAAVRLVEEAVRFAVDLGAWVVSVPVAEEGSEPMLLELERLAVAGELDSDTAAGVVGRLEARLDSRRHEVVERIAESLAALEDMLDDTNVKVALELARPPCGLPDRRALAMVMSRSGHRVGCWHDLETEAAWGRLGLGSRSSVTGRFADRILGEFISVHPGEAPCRPHAHRPHQHRSPITVIRPAANVNCAGLRAVARQFTRPAA